MINQSTYQIIISEEVDKFLEEIDIKAKNKIFYNLRLVSAGYKDNELFKKLEGTDIWEFRTLYNGIAYRLLAFFDPKKRAFIVTTHGFKKKTRKTPKKEIEKAEEIRKEYLKNQ